MNMRDIAKLAGVSSATVSNVINGSRVVRPETAERVRRVIEETHFVPNGSAATLKMGRSSAYGLIIPDITNPFFPEFIRSFEAILVEQGQDMLMATTDLHHSHMQQRIRRMLIQQVDGIALLAGEIETGPIEALIHHRVPVVTMDRRVIGRGLSDVQIDYLSGMREAVRHLKRLRHRRFAYIGGSAGPTISDHRIDAFRTALTEAGLKARPEMIFVGDYRITGGEAAMEEILRLKDRPTAILCTNDLTAIGALRVLRRHGLTAPDDFSLVGFDDIELSDIIFPPLTTIRLSRSELARTFYKALARFGKDPGMPGKRYTVSSSLVVRDSTGPVPSR